MAISDKSNLEATLQQLMSGWRRTGASTGASIGPMAGYAEVPLFIDSRNSRLIQLADFVAYWVFRAYEHDDRNILNGMLDANAFHRTNGTLHGLVHLVGTIAIALVPACASRRRD